MSTLSRFSSGAGVAALLVVWAVAGNRAQSAEPHTITGAWTLNKDLSDQPPERGDRDQGDVGRGTRGGGGGGGRRGGGGFGGGRGMGRGGGGMGRPAAMNPEDMARMRDAMRDLTNPSDHLTIVETESMVVITAADGRTTRLSTDGKKIKDDNTHIERKTKWDGAKLVTEISGLGPAGKATQTLAADPETHQLRIVVQMEGGRSAASGQGASTGSGQSRGQRTITHVYDDDKYRK
jgi:hypothetical protein